MILFCLRCRYIYFILLLLNFVGRGAFAQNRSIHFTSLTSKDGLSSNTVHAILKDRFGFVWFATDDGLNKFNGTDFTVYRHDANNAESLQSNDVVALCEDRSGRLWVGTSGGSVHLYNRQKNSFLRIKTGKTDTTISSNYIRKLCSDYQGKLWVGTLIGLNVYDPVTHHVTKFSANDGVSADVASKEISCIFEDTRKRLWVGTHNGLYLYNRKTNNFSVMRHDDANPYSLAANQVKAIAEDKLGNVWIGTTNGLSMMLEHGQGFKNFKSQSSNPQTISSDLIYAIGVVSKEKIWLGTENGLSIMDIASGKVTRYVTDNRNNFTLTGKSIRSMFIDPQGICWLAIYEGGINKYDSNLTFFGLKTSNPYDEYGLSAPFVTSFAQGPADDVFVGTDGGGLNLYHPKSNLIEHLPVKAQNKNTATTGLSILALAKGSDQNLWIGTYHDGLFKYNTQTTQFKQFVKGPGAFALNNNDVFCLMEDRRKNLWVGTNGGGVNVYNSLTNIFTKYSKIPESNNLPSMPLNGYIRAFAEDQSGNVWIGSFGSGIAVFNPVTNTFTHIDEEHGGLPGNIVNALHVDKNGNVWVGTGGEGLVMIDQKTKKITRYAEDRGLANGVIYKIIEDTQGRLWVSTNKGISWFDPLKKKFTNYSYYNGLQNNVFVQGAGLRALDGTLYFGGTEGFNYIDPAKLRTNKNVPAVVFTDLMVGSKTVTAADKAFLKEDILVAKELYLNYKQNFSISYVALNYTSPKQNRYAYRLKGFEKEWINAGSKTIAYYTNLNPGEYLFEVKASNNDGVWNNVGKSIKIIVKPPVWMTWYAYALYILTFVVVLLYIRYRGIKKLQREFKYEQERREADRLHELDRLKIKFLTNLSHEFRTPIALIMAPADKLLNQETDESTSTQLKVIKRNARRLLNMVNQLLDFRKLEEHELKLNLIEGEVVSFLKEVSESFQDLSEKRKIAFVFNTGLESLVTSFDPDKLERIVFNLLSNAFKFTPEGGKVMLILHLRTNVYDPNLNQLVIEITDTGIGIAKEQQALIFDRFFQSNGITAVLNQGSGIGLSIAKEFTQMHGGTITVDSLVGKGSNFTVELPVVLQQQAKPNSSTPIVQYEDTGLQQKQNKASDLTNTDVNLPPLILIVEDNEDFRFYLKDNLKGAYRIIEATNGKEGWQKSLACHPDIIVSDIMMPYVDGIEFSLKIKSDKRTNHIPLILLTASHGEEEQLRGLTSGANDYLTKPFNFDILKAKIKNLLTFNRMIKRTYTKQLVLAPTEIKVESANEKFLTGVVEYIEANLTNAQLSVEDLSRHVGMSRGSLYNKLLDVSGQSPVDFIRSIKLQKAAALLKKSDMNITQIAYAVGFATPNYFAKSFKAKYNVLPSEYANQNRRPAEAKNIKVRDDQA